LIGNRSISSLIPKDIIKVAKLVEARGAADQAARLLQRLKSFTRWATANQLVEVNPSGDIKPNDVLMKREIINRPAIQQDQLYDFMMRLADYQGDKVVAAGIKFLTLTALRPTEVRHLEWTDINFKTKTLTIPAERMKMRSGSAKLNRSDKCIIGVFSLGKGAGAGDLYEQIIWAANAPRV